MIFNEFLVLIQPRMGKTMKAVVYNKYGPPDVLEIVELEKPIIKNNEILVKANATSVNPVDWKIRNGSLKILTGKNFPKGLGGDVAGKIVKVGDNVSGFKIGDEVYGKVGGLKGNTHAEFVVAKSEDLTKKPQNIDFSTAATVPLAALTAYQALVTIGDLKENSKVLINGCTGGVGHFAVQIAKALGANVTGVCSSKNVAVAKKLGSDEVIDYTKNNVTSGKVKYDIFFDAVANQSYKEVKSILNKGGTYITTLPSVSVVLTPITGLFSSKKAKMINVKSNPRDLQLITNMIENSKVKPIIAKIYQLKDIQEAHRYSETGRVVGKLAISIT